MLWTVFVKNVIFSFDDPCNWSFWHKLKSGQRHLTTPWSTYLFCWFALVKTVLERPPIFCKIVQLGEKLYFRLSGDLNFGLAKTDLHICRYHLGLSAAPYCSSTRCVVTEIIRGTIIIPLAGSNWSGQGQCAGWPNLWRRLNGSISANKFHSC